jgi:hypothetical protein
MSRNLPGEKIGWEGRKGRQGRTFLLMKKTVRW